MTTVCVEVTTVGAVGVAVNVNMNTACMNVIITRAMESSMSPQTPESIVTMRGLKIEEQVNILPLAATQ